MTEELLGQQVYLREGVSQRLWKASQGLALAGAGATFGAFDWRS